MWGGVKSRTQYGDHFRQWTATKGLDELRRVMYREPRPWLLAFGLHQRQHLLQDHHCARLIAWCTTIVQLRESRAEKQEAYRFSQEVFGMLTHSHKVGPSAFAEYMRLCAVGKDLTTAYEWHKFWLETRKPQDGNTGAPLLQQYAWLLRIALESPNEEAAADMAAAVREGYSDRCCTPMVHEATGDRVLAHFQPTTPDEDEALHSLFCAFQALVPKIPADGEAATGELLEFIQGLNIDSAAAQRWVADGWPTRSHCHNFPQLEAAATRPAPTPSEPRLRDSLLHPRLVQKLESASFAKRSASEVISILKWYQESLALEKDKKDRAVRQLHQRKLDGEDLDVWRQFSDPSAQRLRATVVEAGGLTPELYHYVLCALAQSQPTAVLRTLQRMRESGLSILDPTRAVAIIGAQGSFPDQLDLFKEQLDETARRQKLDADHDITKQVELYWKFDYTGLFHYRNAMDEAAFYAFLMDGLPGGPRDVQTLLLASGACGPTATEEDLVLLSDGLRKAAVRHFRRVAGDATVETALDIITQHMPKLDVSLMGALPHFADYTLAEGHDDIATDAKSLAEKLRAFDVVYVLDTSFVETSEAFLKVGLDDEGRTGKKALVLIPYTTLAQLADSVDTASGGVVTFDPALAEAVSGEPFLASQRLRALYAMWRTRSSVSGSGKVRVLHFTEALLAHRLPHGTVEGQLGLNPATNDDDHLTLVLSLVSSLCKPEARVVLCSDDERLIAKVTTSDAGDSSSANQHLQGLFRTPVDVLTTQPPNEVNTDSGLIDDNPTLDFDDLNFEPKLAVSSAFKSAPATLSVTSTSAAASGPKMSQNSGNHDDGDAVSDDDAALVSPWLSLLTEDAAHEEEMAGQTATPTSDAQVVAPASTASARGDDSLSLSTEADEGALAAKEAELMNLYESPHDVVPVGAKMMEAAALGSVFSQFDVLDPEEAEERRLNQEARQSRLQQSGSAGGGARRRSSLEREMLNQRGTSYRERQRMARQLSNMSGGRVPFNLRYKVVEANVNDPRNAHLRRKYEEGMRKSREHYRKNRTP